MLEELRRGLKRLLASFRRRVRLRQPKFDLLGGVKGAKV